MSADEDALAVAAEAGIHRLAIPTPFQVGRINAYLIEDSSRRWPHAATRSRT